MCITRWMNTRTKREPSKIHSFSFRKCLIVIYSHKYVNVLQIIIKDIENEKVRCVFQNSWRDFVVSGFEVIAHDNGIFPRSIVMKLASNCVIKLKLTAAAVIYLKSYMGGVRWHFSAPEVDAEILVPYAIICYYMYGIMAYSKPKIVVTTGNTLKQ